MDLADWLGVLGFIISIGGLTLGILNYLRDAIRVSVEIEWDCHSFEPGRDSDALCARITLTNCSRRPVYIKLVGYGLRNKDRLCVSLRSGEGKRLSEADPPLVYYVGYKGDSDITEWKHAWRNVAGIAVDSTGRRWLSKKPPRDAKRPSWA